MTASVECPKCRVMMNPISYQGITVDKCPRCEGVWLDKGEESFVVEVLRRAENKSCEDCMHLDGRKCKLHGIVVSRDFHCANHLAR